MDPSANPPSPPTSETPAAARIAPPRESPAPGLLSGSVSLGIRLSLLVLLAMLVVALFQIADVLGVFTSSRDQISASHHSLMTGAAQRVAIVTVDGAILDGEGGFVKRQLDAVRRDPAVKAVVLRINSPGGTVTASDYLYHHLLALRRDRDLPVVVSMGGMAASGGYYLAMAVGDTPDSIYAEPSTWTGSIGVIIPHYNVAGLVERWEVEEDSIKSHPLKQMGNPLRRMTEQERAIFQGLVDESFGRFKRIVQAGRPAFRNQPAALDAVATGQVFTTGQALASGLVDREGFLEDAITRALELAGLDPTATEVIRYRRPASWTDLVLAGDAKGPPAVADLSAILELLSPRAYYLCTWLPPMSLD